MKNDVLKWGALVAALVATASAEYELARAVGFNQWVAAAVPAALDLYTVRALRAHKEVLAAVAAMIGVNAASHLVTTGLLPVNVWLVVAVAAIAPLVLWRVHSLGTGHDEPVSTIVDTAPEVTAPVTVERADGDQPPPALEPAPLVIPPLGEGVFWSATKASDLSCKVTASVPAVQAREVVTEVVALTPAELRRKASALHRQVVTSGGRGVTIDQLREEFGLSRRDAAELRRQVVTPVGGDRS
ncbi:hypothetical protein QBA38_16200 [Streptomyces stelliscabiei]|jgi:hypothetical protein|uniref:hypothetical protein n=1 Tax=Streptomyces stelliscabiei TaxID=146820 RepID=UPI002FEFB278